MYPRDTWHGAVFRNKGANLAIHTRIPKMKDDTEITIQELYELLSKRLDDMDLRHTKRLNEIDTRFTQQLADMDTRFTQPLADMDARHIQRLNELDVRHTQRLDQIDERLRGVEAGIAELQGRKAGFTLLKDWVVVICAIAALIVSIIALTH